MPKPRIIVEQKPVEVYVDKSLSASAIAKLQQARIPKINAAYRHSGAITESQVKVSPKIEYRVKTNATGQVCFAIRDIRLEMTPISTVFIAWEHPVNSCMSTALWQHELNHVQANIQSVQIGQQILAKVARKSAIHAGVVGPVSRQAMFDSDKATKARIAQDLKIAVANIDQQRGLIADGIDTVKTYQKLSTLCPDRKIAVETKK